MGEVIRFPNVRSCWLCQHQTIDQRSVSYCELFGESIDSEIFAARDCAGYEPW